MLCLKSLAKVQLIHFYCVAWYVVTFTTGRPLFYMGLYLFHHLGLIDTFKLDIMKLRKFLTLVEECYHPENSYHNCTHAADVTQALHCLLSDSSVSINKST